MERAVAEYPASPPTFQRTAFSMGHLSRSGVFGDATAADAERGARWREAVVGAMAGLWREFLLEESSP